eukprot:GHVT01032146.1.p1 GENE.GHVT01032146.1~~GHVT01032146.1.p1  ORF type:complete len:330 (+),score=28.15 GHVT01032146.1:579-1568(+)
MADPIASPDFTQKALERSEQLERSLDRSPTSSRAGPLRMKTAPSSSGVALGSVTVGLACVMLLISGSVLVGKSIGHDGAPWVPRPSPSPATPQVVAGGQAKNSLNRISHPAASIEAPATRHALRGSTDKAPPKAALFSPTEMKAFKECLEVESAGSTRLVAASNSSSSTGVVLTGRRLGLFDQLPDCRKWIPRIQIIALVLLAMVAMDFARAIYNAGDPAGNFRCDSETFSRIYVKGLCFVTEKYPSGRIQTTWERCPYANPEVTFKCSDPIIAGIGKMICHYAVNSLKSNVSYFTHNEDFAYIRTDKPLNHFLTRVDTSKCELDEGGA